MSVMMARQRHLQSRVRRKESRAPSTLRPKRQNDGERSSSRQLQPGQRRSDWLRGANCWPRLKARSPSPMQPPMRSRIPAIRQRVPVASCAKGNNRPTWMQRLGPIARQGDRRPARLANLGKPHSPVACRACRQLLCRFRSGRAVLAAQVVCVSRR